MVGHPALHRIFWNMSVSVSLSAVAILDWAHHIDHPIPVVYQTRSSPRSRRSPLLGMKHGVAADPASARSFPGKPRIRRARVKVVHARNMINSRSE
jgi:hypothetical protein